MNRTIATAALAFLTASAAAQPLKPEEMVKFRQAAYTTMAWNMGKIKAMVEGAAPFNQTQISAAANAIAALANAGMGSLYAPETLGKTGYTPTRLKEEFFKEPEEVRKIAAHFIEQANRLAEIAAMGRKEEIAKQLSEVSKACKACHDKYRAEER
ncbi:MAG: cytochrome c [Hydrogenophilus sp.]|nr:cytochrome c [Hydrogenophilus sp.]